MRTALVMGATGYTGREVVRELVRAGVRTVAHVRPDSPRLAEWRARFEALGAEVDTTAWDDAALAVTLAALRPDALFALLGTTRARARAAAAATGTADSYESVDYGLTVRLVAACRAAGVRPRFVYLSAIGTGPGSSNAYGRWRWKAEDAVRRSGLPFTVARPAIITGPDRDDGRRLEHVAGVVGDALLRVLAMCGARELAARYRSTTNRTLAAALVRTALDPAAEGAVLEGAALR